MEHCSLQQLTLGLQQPSVPRQVYQQVLLKKDESIFDGDASESLQLLRPYLQPLLRSRGLHGGPSWAPTALTATKVQCLQYATVNPHVPASRSLPCCAEAKTCDYHSWLPMMPKNFQHPLGFLSLQAYLVKAFCLPPKVNDLGSLSFLDGTPYSMYSMPSSISSSVRVDTDAGATPLHELPSQEDVDVDAVVSARAFSFVMVHVYRGALPKERW
eukprot:symbB.v1.2.017978.t1/scaffold1402.1/size121251/7